LDNPFPAYTGDEPYLFVCYAHKDDTIVYPEILVLHDKGLNIWYDEGISAGKVWLGEVAKVIAGATKILFYISKAALESANCKREIHYALSKNIEILPVYLEDVELSEDLEIGLSLVQALFREKDNAYQYHLLSALALPGGQEQASLPHSQDTLRASIKPPIVTAKRAWIGSVIILVAVVVFSAVLRFTTDVTRAGSIAVMTFENLSGDPTQEFFSDGFADEIISLLTQVKGLQVAARTSTFLFKNQSVDIRDVAWALGVKTVLTGSVRRNGSQVRITAQLIDGDTGFNVWSKTFNREMGDILTLQNEVAMEVLLSLQGSQEINLVQVASTPEVYEDFLRARSLLYDSTQESLTEAADLLDDLLARVPDDARIHAARARAWIWLSEEQYGDVPMLEALTSARPHVDAALELAPLVGDSHTTLGLLLLFERRFKESGLAFERATELTPGDALPWHFLYFAHKEAGGWAKSREALAQAARLDPLYPSTFLHYFFVFNNIRTEAIDLFSRFEDRWPGHRNLLSSRANIALQRGELAEAERLQAAYCKIEGIQSPMVADNSKPSLCGNFQIDMYFMLGMTDKLVSVGALNFEPPLLDAFMCPVDSLRPINALAAHRLAEFDAAESIWDAAIDDDIDRPNGAVYAASNGNWDEVRNLLEPLAESLDASRVNLVSLHPVHMRFYIADLALARKMTGDETGAQKLLAQLEDLALEIDSMYQSQLVSETTVHLLDMSIAAVKGDKEQAFASYELAYDIGYRFRSPINDPLLLQWRDTEGFNLLQSRYDADITHERNIVLGRYANAL